LENILVDENTCPYEKVHKKLPNWIINLCTFSEIGIVYDNVKIKAKLDDRGFPCLFIGYTDDHSPGVFMFFNFNKKSVMLSRNVLWMNKYYAEYTKLPDPSIYKENTDQIIEVSDDDDKNEPSHITEEEDEVQVIPPFRQPPQSPDVITISDTSTDTPSEASTDSPLRSPFGRISGLNRAMRNLQTYYNPDPTVHGTNEQANYTMDQPEPLFLSLDQSEPYGLNHASSLMIDELPNMALSMMPDMDIHPSTYKDAMFKKDRSEWWKAMVTEFDNIITKRVWKIIKKSDLPKGRKIIGNRWVFSRKDDGRYRARSVAKGYSQIPGKDFQENHAPVVHDTTFHMILVMKIMHKLFSRQFDIETAFLYGDLEEEIYMIFPDGYERYLREKGEEYNASDHCVLLTKALYGLVQAARQWWRKITEVFAKINFFPTKADPCLFVKKRLRKKHQLSLYFMWMMVESLQRSYEGIIQSV